MKKSILWLALYAGLLMIMPVSLMAQEVIKIGVLAPLDIPVGKGLKNAVEMATEEINDSGGILGKKIELVIADDKMKPVIGAYEYTRLATQEKVAAVLGTFASEVALAVVEQVPKYKVPFIGGTATPEVTEKVKQNYDSLKYVFKVFHNGYEIADFSSEWLIREMIGKRGLKSFALIVENANWARPVAAKWERELKDAGALMPVIEYFDKNTKDFKPMFAKIAEAKCEMICILTAIIDASPLITQWADSKGTLLGGISGSFTTAWKNTDGKALSMISLSFPGIFGLNAKDKAFSAKYLEKYKVTPEYTAPYIYDSLYILKAAVEKAKSIEADAIVDAMEKTDHEGIMGRWIFDKASHHSKFGPGFRQFMMMQWQPGEKACIIYPDENKTCEMIFPQWK
jgi:branched-chain amino acid transport system substrate-binding protein